MVRALFGAAVIKLILSLWCTTLSAAEPPNREIALDKSQQQPVVLARPAIVPASSDAVEVLKAQLVEIRRSEDRMFATILATLGTVGTIALGLAAFSWWSARYVYQRDLEKAKEDLDVRLSKVIQDEIKQLAHSTVESQKKEFASMEARMHALLFWKLAQLRMDLGDLSGSIDSWLEFAATLRERDYDGYRDHAASGLAKAIDQACKNGIVIEEGQLSAAKEVVTRSRNRWNAQATELEQAISRYATSSRSQ